MERWRERVCMFRGEIKRQRKRDREKGGEMERGERDGYINIAGERYRERGEKGREEEQERRLERDKESDGGRERIGGQGERERWGKREGGGRKRER